MKLALLLLASYSWQAPTEFDAASVKPSTSFVSGRGAFGIRMGGPGTSRPGSITWDRVSLRNLVRTAYSLKEYQVDGPSWLDTVGADIAVKVPAGTTKEQALVMWQNLLAQRFLLKFHRESREIPAYELTVADKGSKLQESGAEPPPRLNPDGTTANPGMPSHRTEDGCSAFDDGRRATSMMKMRGFVRFCGAYLTIDATINQLAAEFDRPVLDATSLKGKYNFKLEFNGLTAPADADPAPSVFEAFQNQLGLKLTAKKAPVEMLVVDSMERTPTAN